MTEEIKKEQQAPAQVPEDKKPQDQQPTGEQKPQATALAHATPETLQELYNKSPDLFEKAGLVKKPEPKKEEPPKPDPKPQSAAPAVKYGDKEITLPTDVPVNKQVVDKYLEHAKSVGMSVEQVQANIDFQTAQAREVIKAQRTLEQQDAANVAILKKDFGEDYEKNMEIARQAAVEHADPEMLEMLKTSNPTLVKHFLKLGKANAEVPTPKGGKPRVAEDPKDAAKKRNDQLQKRYNRSPELFGQGPK